jgi:hypothetical protein
VPPHPTATAQTTLNNTTADLNRAPIGRGSPIEMSGRCALSAVFLRGGRGATKNLKLLR